MKRIISAASALAVAASMAVTAFPFTAGAAASKTYELRTYPGRDGKAVSTTISADAIASGDVVIPVGFYLVESEKTTAGMRAQWTVNSTDGDASNTYVSFNQCEPNSEYFDSEQTVTWNGQEWSTNRILGFAGTLTKNRKGTAFIHTCPQTAIFSVDTKQDSSNCKNAFGSAVWTPEADGSYEYLGAKSDDYPVTVFEVVFKKGTPAGTYTLDFINYHDDPAAPVNSTCQIETETEKMTKDLGNLDLKGLTIKIEGNNSGNGNGNTNNNGQTASDFIVYGTDCMVKPGETKSLEFGVQSGGHKVILSQCHLDFPSELKPTISDNFAYCAPHDVTYTELGNDEWTATFKDPKTSDAVALNDNEPIIIVNVTIPANATPGTQYKCGFKTFHIVEDAFKPTEFEATVKYATLTVGDGGSGNGNQTTQPPQTGTQKDFIITGGTYNAKPGDTVEVEFAVSSNGHKVVLTQCSIDVPSPLTYKITDNFAYCAPSDVTYSELGKNQWTATFKDPKTSEAVALNDSEPIMVMNVTVPASTPDGTYLVGFKEYHVVEDSFKPIEFNATVNYAKIIVGNGGNSNPGTNPGGKDPIVVPGDVSDFVITGENVTMQPGETKDLEFKVSSGGHMVVLGQCELDIPSPLTYKITDNFAYCAPSDVTYSELGTDKYTATFKDPKTSEAVALNDKEPIMIVTVTVPKNAAAGTTYQYGFKYYHIVEDSFKPIEFDTKIVYGVITVGDGGGNGGDDKYILGDANMDGTVDASDASDILAEYAARSTKSPTTFTADYDYQCKVSDVNKDGSIDATDASLVLEYYAYLSTTSNPITNMEAWIKTR